MKQTYIVKGYRSAVGKAPKGSLRFTRPDRMAADVIKHMFEQMPDFDKETIEDVIVGCAMPEAEQGLNMARLISLMGLNTDKVPGVTVNRYCASGSEAIAIAAAKIATGMADCILAGGAESMSFIPMGGYKPMPETGVSSTHPDYYWGMGLTAEAVAKEYNIDRASQDAFALESHKRALKAIENNRFKNQIAPLNISQTYLDQNQKQKTTSYVFDTDEGPRADSSIEALSRLKPVFKANGSVTAGNSSQMSDGAAFLLVVSEDFLKTHNLTPIARLVTYNVVGVPPRIMGIGPLYAIPKALQAAGLNQNDIDLFELNEAFASQSLAVINGLGLDSNKVNVNGGAISLGHPLGCTGAKLTIQLLDELEQQNKKYGMVTMCVGTGQGAASIFEKL